MTSERIESLFMQCGRIHKDAEMQWCAAMISVSLCLQCGRIHKDAEIVSTKTKVGRMGIYPSMWPHP